MFRLYPWGLICLILTFGEVSFAQNQPNIVFFLVDDLGWADLSCYGNTFHDSPNIDQLAQSGMRFTDAYSASPVCSPTRAAIMTGKHPVRVRIMDWIPGMQAKNRKLIPPEDRNELALSETSLAEALKERGYQTFFAGKWHLGSEGFWPEDQGFDINKGGHHKGSPPGGYYVPYKNPALENGPDGEYLTDRLGDEAVKFLEGRSKDNPFLLYLSFYSVHTPIQANKRHLKEYEAKATSLPVRREEESFDFFNREFYNKRFHDRPDYATMVRTVDDNVGKVLETLERLDLNENTIIVFTSDNGGLSTGAKRNRPTTNTPLRLGKGWTYEGGIRVPLIIRVPGLTKAGLTSNMPVVSMDYFPTLLELAGQSQKQEGLDGISLVPVLKGDSEIDRQAIVWYYPYYHGSLMRPGAAIRLGDWKLVEFFEDGKLELFNLKEDISENNNLMDKFPEKALSLRKTMYHKLQEMDTPMPTLNLFFEPKSN